MLRILFFPPSGLLQSAVITLYTVYLTWSALLYDPGKCLTVANAKVGLIQENAVGTWSQKPVSSSDKRVSPIQHVSSFPCRIHCCVRGTFVAM